MSSFRSRQRSQKNRQNPRSVEETQAKPVVERGEPSTANASRSGSHGRPSAKPEQSVIHTQPARMPRQLALFAPCPRGLEEVLAKELNQLDAQNVTVSDGGVSFSGSPTTMMQANLHCRTASRILIQLANAAYQTEKDIHRLALSIDWPRHFNVNKTIKVKTDGIRANVRSLEFVSLTVKDAICDRFRQVNQGRPSVDTHYPDMRIMVFVNATHATIYLDTSGEALFKRGWRDDTGEAPLRENLAAGILLLAGYDGSQALLDPMMGSGTFLVEAADIALNRAPGRYREFAFKDFRNYESLEWERVRLAAKQQEKPITALPIVGSDRSVQMLNIAKENLRAAGLSQAIQVSQADILNTRPHAETGLIVTNPPYGVRLEEQDKLVQFYPEMGAWLKQNFANWTAFFLTADMRLPALMRLQAKRRTPLYNGGLECRLFMIPMVEGSNRENSAPSQNA